VPADYDTIECHFLIFFHPDPVSEQLWVIWDILSTSVILVVLAVSLSDTLLLLL